MASIALVLALFGGGFYALTADDDGDETSTAPGEAKLALTINPSEGTDGQNVTISVTGANDTAATVTYDNGDLSDQMTLANGAGSVTHVFNKAGSDIVNITVTAGGQTATGRFKFVDPNAPVQPTITLEPSSGPPGTKGDIVVTGDKSASVTLKFDGVAGNAGKTDADGEYTYENYAYQGDPGSTVTVTAQTGAGPSAPIATAVFTITDGAEDAEEVLVSLSPAEGPSNTKSKITVTGRPDSAVTLTIDGKTEDGSPEKLQRTGKTNSKGVWTVDHIFVGPAPDDVVVTAQIGEGVDAPTGEAIFKITEATISAGPFIFVSSFQVATDPAKHAGPIGMPNETELVVRIGSIFIDGEAPFVPVSGELSPDGTFDVSAKGTVAGFDDITVRFVGTLAATTLTGQYIMGVDGGLPTGEPIVYDVSGELAGQAPADEAPDFEAFYQDFNNAQTSGDVNALLAALHPAVIEVFGEPACTAYLERIVNPDVRVAYVDQLSDAESWLFEGADQEVTVEDAYTLEVAITVGDADPVVQETHLAVADGELAWFTQCDQQ